MKQFVRDYFSFNKRERNGIRVLLIILAGLVIWIAAMKGPEQISESFTEQYWSIRKDSGSVYTAVSHKEKTSPEAENKTAKPLFYYFDPNSIGLDDWQKLGLSARQAKVILNYVNKGGKFRKKEDLEKIYGMNPELVKALQPWVRIAADSVFKKQGTAMEKPPETKKQAFKLASGFRLELNGSDSLSLLRLPCIGPAFARRILAYRNRLGGFVNTVQLKEVYGLDEERFTCLEDYVKLDTSLIQHIFINRISEEELRKHPYFKWSLARSICAFRKQHGHFRHTEDLRKLVLMDSATYQKIAPYISCGEASSN